MSSKTFIPNYSDASEEVKSKAQVDLEIFVEEEKILCNHCLRTSNNAKRCIGRCVADSEY